MDSSILLRKKPATLLILLKDINQTWYVAKLAKQSNTTYVHTTKLLGKFEKEGMVSFKKTGRAKTVSLTERGVQIASAIEALNEKLSSAPAQEAEKKQPQAISAQTSTTVKEKP
ncbi:hypothetical protein COV61_03030 [Candidatus Micrarchaeota archaeon CG11_big_fil_rev_8_21_14_0_20_47_5]|nr:MAG: hypothetical protein AUJ17_03605 [Candidatus Micrarchaeota archaeon CG1_02_47_40]PIN83450.1 MAG: hypothetical protein COV61_03030 [Candidatus Micrarchaeota archaeon CG11_big_fil_rev_8_21_14_0_20_47_5]